MDASQFQMLVQRTSPTQGLRVRFDKTSGMIGLMRLNAYCGEGAEISVDDKDKILVAAILQSRDWGSDRNRSIVFRGLSNLENNALYQIGRDVESIELIDQHGAQCLMAGGAKGLGKATSAIISGVLTGEFVREIEDWGVTIEGHYTEYLGSPAIQFMICVPDGEMIQRTILDGWSGRFGIDGNVNNGPNEPYTRPEQLQDFIRTSLEKRLDEMTTAAAA
jgi:hypothetical protein